MKPASITTTLNKNGILTIYVLMDDGTILKKAENDGRWTEVDCLPGHRNEQENKPDMVSRDKGTKKRRG